MPFGPKPFVKGTSGNPNGRTKEQRAREQAFSKACRARVGDNLEEVVDVIVAVMRDSTAEPRDRLRACEVILMRVLGKPTESIEIATEPELPPEELKAIEREIAIEHLATLSTDEKLKLLTGEPSVTVQ